jgi:hypothetical protein
MISTKLYNALLEVRHSSFLDYVVSSAKTYEFFVKLELTNNIYSMAVIALVDLKELLKKINFSKNFKIKECKLIYKFLLLK